MKFCVHRTSGIYNEDEPPYNEDGSTKIWIEEINSIEELMKFVDEHGEIILTDAFDYVKNEHGAEYTLEIYDDYRE